jgi:predicted nucleic acid-binding protein
MITAYLDHCVVSGMVCGDLEIAEMSAIPSLIKAVEDGRLQIVTSQESRREQERATGAIRAMLERARPVPLVKENEKLLGMHHYDDQAGGFSTYPMITEYVDATLFEKLKNAGLREADARHLMYAVYNKCDRFVTADRDFLRRRSQLTTLCGNAKIVRPWELAAEF